MTQGFGGFPNPVRFVAAAARDRIIAKTTTLDVPRTNTIQSVHSNGGLGDVAGGPTKAVSYITFDAVVGRNSKFYSLTAAQRDELGGVEYRVSILRLSGCTSTDSQQQALSLLLKIVAAYYILVQLIPMIIFAPVMQIMYRGTFQDQGTITNAGGWYAAFNVVSAYSNSGLSLLDESMTLFQTAYRSAYIWTAENRARLTRCQFPAGYSLSVSASWRATLLSPFSSDSQSGYCPSSCQSRPELMRP